MAEISQILEMLRPRAEPDRETCGGSRGRALRCAWCLHWISGCVGATKVSHGLCGECLVQLCGPELLAQRLADSQAP